MPQIVAEIRLLLYGYCTFECTLTVDPISRGGARLSAVLSKSCSDPKIIVVGAAKVENGDSGHIRLTEMPDYSAGTLHPCITGTLAPSGHRAPESPS